MYLIPFILYNIDGYFYHLLEYLKQIAAKGFAEPLPFIVVDSSKELEVVFRLLKLRYFGSNDSSTVYNNTRQLIYELPYFLKKKTDSSIHVEDLTEDLNKIRTSGTPEQQHDLDIEIEQAYLEKEIERMYERLAKTGRDTSVVSDKLTKLKKRRQQWK